MCDAFLQHTMCIYRHCVRFLSRLLVHQCQLQGAAPDDDGGDAELDKSDPHRALGAIDLSAPLDASSSSFAKPQHHVAKNLTAAQAAALELEKVKAAKKAKKDAKKAKKEKKEKKEKKVSHVSDAFVRCFGCCHCLS